jgi:hypothetical protein
MPASLVLPFNCILTVLMETILFALIGKRRGMFLVLCAAVNVATNLTLNLIVRIGEIAFPEVLLLEAAVVCIEYLVYALYEGRSLRLFVLTFAANLATYLTGVLIYGV